MNEKTNRATYRTHLNKHIIDNEEKQAGIQGKYVKLVEEISKAAEETIKNNQEGTINKGKARQNIQKTARTRAKEWRDANKKGQLNTGTKYHKWRMANREEHLMRIKQRRQEKMVWEIKVFREGRTSSSTYQTKSSTSNWNHYTRVVNCTQKNKR